MTLLEALRAGPRESLERVVNRDRVRLCAFVETERIWEIMRALARSFGYPPPRDGEVDRGWAQAHGIVRAAARRVLQEGQP